MRCNILNKQIFFTDIHKAELLENEVGKGKENERGYLSVGRCADLAVLDYADESFDLTDKAGNRITSETVYRCVLTVADGELVYKI